MKEKTVTSKLTTILTVQEMQSEKGVDGYLAIKLDKRMIGKKVRITLEVV